jgi:hypothetical protein
VGKRDCYSHHAEFDLSPNKSAAPRKLARTRMFPVSRSPFPA